MTKIYSVSEEGEWSEDFMDVLHQLDDAGVLAVGATYFEAEMYTPTGSEFFNMDRLVEDLMDNASYEYGDVADSMDTANDNKWEELESLIKTWLDKNLEIVFYAPRNIKECKVLEVDIVWFYD